MRYPFAAAALLTALAFVPATGWASNMNVSVRSGHDVKTCADLEVRFDDRPAVTAEEKLTAAGSQKLTIQSHRNGGVYVWGGSRQDFGITACKAAAPGGPSLDQLRASLNGGTLTASGPSSDGWVVYFIVDAPTKADVELEVHNGPVQVANIAGATTVRAQNGPIELKGVSGRVSARASNGPIAYEGNSGTVDLTTQNGPLAVRLDGSSWANGTLTASAHNGPVNLRLPRGFASGVRVRSSQHSPWNCRGCDGGRRTWDDSSRLVEFGTGPVAVTLSTENGPVSVDQSR